MHAFALCLLRSLSLSRSPYLALLCARSLSLAGSLSLFLALSLSHYLSLSLSRTPALSLSLTHTRLGSRVLSVDAIDVEDAVPVSLSL